MSLPLDYPYISTGDREGVLNAWRFTGYDDSNTDRGRLYVTTTAAGGTITVSVYKDLERTLKVAEGSGSALSRITLAEQNSSGISGSVYAETVNALATITIYLSVVSDRDLEKRDERISGLLPEEPLESTFVDIWEQVMIQLYLQIQAIYPPPVFAGDPLRFPGTASVQEAGSKGLPDIYSIELWTLNSQNEWELKGLQNPRDFVEWGINYALYLIWNRKVRSADDPIAGRAMHYLDRANTQWDMVPILADTDRDGIPERPVKTRTMTLRRG